MTEVEGSFVEYMRATVLTEDLVERIVAEVRTEVEHAVAGPSETTGLERELDTLRDEQKKYAAALATAPDVEELLAELRKRSDRIKRIEAELAAASRLPEMRREIMAPRSKRRPGASWPRSVRPSPVTARERARPSWPCSHPARSASPRPWRMAARRGKSTGPPASKRVYL